MAINQSKINDSRQWEKWRRAGAVETITDTQQRALRSTWSNLEYSDKVITAIGEHYTGSENGCSTLSLGDRIVNSGPGWSVSEPAAYLVVPGHNYRLGQRLDSMPRDAKPLESYFGRY